MELGPDWPHRIVISKKINWMLVQDWCELNIGIGGEKWNKLGIDPAAYLFGDYDTTWFFKSEEDAVLFLLKWS